MDYLFHMRSSHTAEDEDWLNKACAPARREKATVQDLREMKKKLLELYLGYSSYIENPHAKPPATTINDSEKKVLLDFYSGPPASLKPSLQEWRNDHELLECPFCGNPFIPNTLDHFLPKDFWPEFAIYPNNLVPQCRGCASNKGSKYYCSGDNHAMFIHPMFFKILESVRFLIEVSLVGDKAKFTITFNFPDVYNADVVKTIQRHFYHLNVVARVNSFCIKKFAEWKRKLERKQFDITQALQVRLGEVDGEIVGKDWESALYKGMLSSVEVMDYLTSITPPIAAVRRPALRRAANFNYVPAV